MLMVRDWDTPLAKPWDVNQAQLMVSIQQSFVSRQKRDLRAKVAGDDAELAASNLESLRQEIAAEARKACAGLMRNAEEMQRHDRQASLLKEALAAYAVFHATHTGQGGPVPPTGRQMSTDYVYVMQFRGENISHMTKIWKSELALKEIGWA